MAKPLKITNLKIKLLEYIFKDFFVNDLINVADAHPYLCGAARSVYDQKYGCSTLKIRHAGQSMSIHNKSNGLKETINANAKTFLEHFGECVIRLKLNYAKNSSDHDDRNQWRDIECAIFKHCAKTMIAIGLKNCRGNEFDRVPTPFENVHTVCIMNEFDKTVDIRLSKWFPNTRIFDMRETAIRHDGCIRTFFRHLEYIEVNLVADTIAVTNLKNLLQKNPYITELYIQSNANIVVSVSLLQFLAVTLTRLNKLYLVNVNFDGALTMQHIHFNSVNGFWWQTDQLPDNVSITFSQLKRLELFNVSDNHNWIEFIVQNQQLTKLTYIVQQQVKMNRYEFVQFMTKLPHLKAFRIPASSIPLARLIQFLRMSYTLINLITVEVEFTYEKLTHHTYQRFEDVIDCTLKGAFVCRQEIGTEYENFQGIIVERSSFEQ